MKRRLKIYFIHSTKYDYNNQFYRLILSSPICLSHELMLPYTKEYQGKYVKDLIEEADIIIAEINKYSFGLKYELKLVSKTNKPIKYISLSNEIPKKLKKLVPEIEFITEDKSFVLIVEEFIKKYSKISEEEYVDTTIILGEL